MFIHYDPQHMLALKRTKQENVHTYRVYSSPRTTAGVWIDAETSLMNATVFACQRYLTSAVGQLPWRVMRETPKGAERVPTHPADYVIGVRPNPEMGSFTFRESLLGDALRWGNGYAEIERDTAQRTVALHYIHPSRVNPKRDDFGRLEYEVSGAGGGNVILPQSDVFHIRGYGSGPVGINVMQYAAQSIGWAQATMLFGSAFFGQGMNPSGIVEIPGALSREALTALDESMSGLYGGPKGKRTMYLDKGMKFTPITQQLEASQFIESMQHQVEEICRWFGVPPHKVMHLLRATFSNIEHQSIEVVVDSITPWVKRFEEEADYKLFGNNRQGFFTKMNLNGLLRGDSTARATLYAAMFKMAGLSPNDILRLEDMNTIGKDGDRRFIDANLIPLDKLDEKFAADIAPKPAPQPREEPREEPMDFSKARQIRSQVNGNGLQH